MADDIMTWAMLTFLTWAVGFFGIGKIAKNILTINKRQTALLLEIGHYRLNRNCKKALARGYRTLEETIDIKKLYTAYKALGGNGSGDELYNLFVQLPLRKKGGVRY